ncbi:MAG TPA: hypothetical protein VGG10_17355 [Rhizomicrobium sp.]|jgi:hypothetical protein
MAAGADAHTAKPDISVIHAENPVIDTKLDKGFSIILADADDDTIGAPGERRQPGRPRTFPQHSEQNNPGAIEAPPPEAFPADQIPVPDRWRLAQTLDVKTNWWDPYNQNVLKGDEPVFGTQDLFLSLTGILDSVVEPRSFPVPVGVQTTQRPGSLDVFGEPTSLFLSETAIVGASLFKGSTAFKPPDFEARIALALNYNFTTAPERLILNIRPTAGLTRSDGFPGVQEAFVEFHLRDLSDRYDFDAIRIGVQPFSTDFRGFLFQDNQLGVRLFGDRDDNRYQYNLAAFARLEKDTNSGLNDITRLRRDYIFTANFYAQDFPVVGFTSQGTVTYNMNREDGKIHFDDNGFPVRPALIGDDRPREYDVVYLGYNGDGHFGRINLTASAYGALGEDRNNVFTDMPAQIRAFFFAAEPSYDFDWLRVRLSTLYASGDGNPYDNTEHGFDAIFENPQFAGSDTSYFIRQAIPFVGGGRAVSLTGRNGELIDLRSSKDEGQSNFSNPGTILLGLGADADVTPEIRLTGNINHIWFDRMAVVEALRQQAPISSDFGMDYSLALIWRPNMNQNLVFRTSFAILDPGAGFSELFSTSTRDKLFYSGLVNAILTF